MSAALHVVPADALVDQPRHIHAAGLAPGPARLLAESTYPDGSVWRSQAWFDVGADGLLDLDTALPAAGDWHTPEPMGVIWSMRQVQPPRLPELSDGIAARQIALTVEDSAGQRAQAVLVQRFLGTGVRRQEVRESGLSATLFTPAGDGPHPLVIVLNGSGGGTPEQRAALFAAHGYMGLALAYFKAPGRPAYISGTPLEYFETALDWAIGRLQPHRGFVAVSGLSRGGELALLLGATFPAQVSAVIGYVPSAVVHGTLRAGAPEEPRDATAWTWRGQALPNVWQANPLADWHAFDHPPSPDRPIRQAPAFVAAQAHVPSVAAARIPVERIAGPVLLISGAEDGFWPSEAYSEQIVADLQAAGHAWPAWHDAHPGAGHAIGLPYIPTTMIANVHPVAGVPLDGGGTPQANARANRLSWARVLDFLEKARAAHAARPQGCVS